MDAIITVLAILLIIAAKRVWFQAGRIFELEAANERAQAEIQALESRLLDATTNPIRTCEACATYPCKCE